MGRESIPQSFRCKAYLGVNKKASLSVVLAY